MPSRSLEAVNFIHFTKAHSEEIRTFLLSDFHKTEPLNAALEVPPEDVLEFYKKLIGWCEPAISYIARDNASQISGVALACFLDRPAGDKSSLNDPTERYSDKVEKIRCFINAPEDKIWEVVPSSVNRLLYWVFVSVHSDHRRRGIAHRLLTHNLTAAKELGCEGAVAEATALASQKLFEKLEYQNLMELSHADWTDKGGERVFTCKDGTEKAVLYFKRF